MYANSLQFIGSPRLPLEEIAGELLAQVKTGPVQAGLDGGNGEPEDPGRLLVRQPFHVAQDEDDPVLLGKLLGVLADHPPQLLAERIPFDLFAPAVPPGGVQKWDGSLRCGMQRLEGPPQVQPRRAVTLSFLGDAFLVSDRFGRIPK